MIGTKERKLSHDVDFESTEGGSYEFIRGYVKE